MLRSYIKVALRNMRRHRVYAAVNGLGLAAGMAACLLIALYVRHELSYDRFHDEADRIVRIVSDEWDEDGRLNASATTPSSLAPAMQQDLASVEHVVRLYPQSALVSRDDAAKFQEDEFLYADSTFFDVFSFPVEAGDAETALDQPFSLILTASTADKLFGSADPVGRTVRVDNQYDFTITAVVADPPANSHVTFDYVASFASLRTSARWVTNNWHYPPMYTYARLHRAGAIAQLEAQLGDLLAQRLGPEELEERQFKAQPLTSIHLRSQRQAEIAPTGRISYVYLFALIALCTLAAACINYVNLATARSAERAKEVGVRKVLGAYGRQLRRQYITESVVLSLLAFGVALGVARALMPVFNAVAGNVLTPAMLWAGPVIGAGVAVALGVGVVAGAYPAFYLARIRPAALQKGVLLARPGSTWARQGLVVFQFATSAALIAATLIIYQQLHYVRTADLGFAKDQVVIVPLRGDDNQEGHEALKHAWVQHPNIEHVTASSGIPGREGVYYYRTVVGEASQDTFYTPTLAVDHDFTETYDLTVVQGRDFDEGYGTDASSGFIINEAAARSQGWTDPIGRDIELYYKGPTGRFVTKAGTIVGVVEDFHYHSLHHAIEPLMLHVVPPSFYSDFLSVRIAGEDVSEALAYLRGQWQAFSPERPFEYSFLDAQYGAQYRAEERLGLLIGLFSGLAIFIGCLGLFGLAAFTAQRRTKEIGVRKALGASVASIIVLLSTDLLRTVAVAFVVAAPIAYIFMDRWLDGFAYRVEVGVGVFLAAGAATLCIAFASMSYQAIRAALADPVDALRTE